MRRRVPLAIIAATLSAAVALCGCTGSSAGRSSPPQTIVSTQTLTHPPSPVASAPLSSGPTASARGTCPYLSLNTAMQDLGQRLDHAEVLTSGGRAVGCRFYAIQSGPLHTSENLPGPNQPSIAIATSRYPNAAAAHNALARAAGAGRNPSPQQLSGGYPAETYQTSFDPSDHGLDWACSFIVNATLVTVLTANTNAQLDVVELAEAVAPAVAAQR